MTDIARLLVLVSDAHRELVEALSGADWLGPFGVNIRYPGDSVEMAPGDEVRAIEIARFTKEVVLRILDPESRVEEIIPPPPEQ